MKKLILMAVGCIALNLCFADPVWELGQSDKATDTDAQIQNDNYQSDYKRELQTEDDGYQWYKIRSLRRSGRYGSPYGAEDRHGRTIIPCRYDFICYHTTDKYFHVKSSNGGSGIYLPNGTCVISPDRGYTKAYYYKKDGYSYCSVYRGEYEGICDGNGKEIISPDRGYTTINI